MIQDEACCIHLHCISLMALHELPHWHFLHVPRWFLCSPPQLLELQLCLAVINFKLICFLDFNFVFDWYLMLYYSINHQYLLNAGMSAYSEKRRGICNTARREKGGFRTTWSLYALWERSRRNISSQGKHFVVQVMVYNKLLLCCWCCLFVVCWLVLLSCLFILCQKRRTGDGDCIRGPLRTEGADVSTR